jgi:hypothetical protein
MGKIPVMGDEHKEVNRDVRGPVRVTITEAATLLGVHPNTVRGRVKAGEYDAEKVTTEHGLTWMIDRNSLINPPLTEDSQQDPSQVVNLETATPMELVQDLLRPFVEDLGRVREELGAERVRREQAEQERDELRRQLEALQETPGAAESDESGHYGTTSRQEAEESLQGASERRSWWRRFFGLE